MSLSISGLEGCVGMGRYIRDGLTWAHDCYVQRGLGRDVHSAIRACFLY